MRILISVILLLGGSPARGETLTRYTVLFQGKPGGAQTTSVADDGTVRVDLSYRDNGRGPDLKEVFVLGKDGTFREYSGKGTSTFGAPIDDSFRREGDRAEWTSTSDRGGATVSAPSSYVPVQPSPEALARILRAAAARPGRRLPALPGGEVAVEKLLDERFELEGKVREVSLYAL